MLFKNLTFKSNASTKFVFNTQQNWHTKIIITSHQSTKFVFNTQLRLHKVICSYCHQSTKFVFNTQRGSVAEVDDFSVFNTQHSFHNSLKFLVTNLQNLSSIHNVMGLSMI